MSGGSLPGAALGRAVELLARKKSLAREILRLTARQAGLLAPERSHELLQSVNLRQKCIEEMISIDAMLSPVEAKIMDACGTEPRPSGPAVSNGDRQKVEDLRREIQALLKEAQSLDQRNREAIAKECEGLKKSLQSLGVRKSSLKAYQRTAAQSDGYFIDNKK